MPKTYEETRIFAGIQDQFMAYGSRILIIDDSQNGRSAIGEHLHLDDVVIEVETDSKRGLSKVLEDPPDILIVDIAYAGLDGWTIIDRIRRTRHVQELPIIMVTGIADIEMRVQSFEMGADDVIQKPYNAAELNAIVRNTTRLNRFRRLADERNRVEQMFNHVSHSYDQTIEGWVRALDLRDRETEGHSSRVAQMTVQLAGMFRYGDDRIKHLWRGALLHDIGKLAISDTILRKPSALTTEERRIMMKHPMHAHEMLYPIEYLRPALNIPVYHHERWDGTGYPFRIKGDEIPFEARLFSIIDVWDALSYDRPYREAWPQDKVRSYIESETGKHFDPQVVPVFLEFLRQLDSLGKLTAENRAA